MDITENQVYEALEVEPQQDQTQQQTTQEEATPAPEEPREEMSLEQRRENAARRRREETRAAIHQAVEEERQRSGREVEEVLSRAGLKNTLDGTPITNLEEYRAWRKGMEAGEKPQPQPQSQTRPTLNPVAQAQVERELAEIRKLDPSIHSVGDLLTMPKAGEFARLVRRGNSFLDAYKLAHYEELTQRTAQAARQQAMSNQRGKSHLIAAAQRGKGGASVPADQMQLFRAFNPGASEGAIQAYYNKYQGG